MPTVLRWNGYRFYFFSNEGSEPPHIHVDKAGHTAKYWLNRRIGAEHGLCRAPFGRNRSKGYGTAGALLGGLE